MKYCSHCGTESTKKICLHCGSKQNTKHNFCVWCGSEINENATICVNCNERIKPSVFSVFMKILTYVVIAFILLFVIVTISSKSYISAILAILSILLILPFLKNKIKSKTLDNKKARIVINISRRVIVFVLFFVALINANIVVQYDIYTDEATQAAEVVFHENVSLKNEDSFVINDSDVTYLTEPYNGKENLRLVTAVIDYSAQNGFGGMNRKEYTVKILFNTENGEYYRLDGTHISK